MLLILLLFLSCEGSIDPSKASSDNSSVVNGRSSTFDFLRTYSYEIFGSKRIAQNHFIPTGGTGFFFRKNSRLFFITAKHVFTGCPDDSTKVKDFPDTLAVLIHGKENILEDTIQIDISKFYDSLPCNLLKYEPDFIVWEVKNNKPKVTSTIEGFILPPFRKASDLVIFGFPGKEAIINEEFHPVNASLIHLDLNNKRITTNMKLTKENRIDSLNYWVYTDEPLYDLGGYSGSPVFIKDASSDRWQIIGLLASVTAAAPETKQWLTICRIGHVSNEIDRLTH